jgi:hypothetical protein
MKMPRGNTQLKNNGNLKLFAFFFLLFLIVATFSPVSASDTGTLECTKVDQFGNPLCQVQEPGPVSDTYVPEDAPGPAGTGIPAYFSSLREQYTMLQGLITGFSNITGRGVKESINQTLHADNYTYFVPKTNPNTTITTEAGDEKGIWGIYSSLVSGVTQFQQISTLAATGSLRVTQPENRSIWTNRSADDLLGSPLQGPVPDENYLAYFELHPVRVGRPPSETPITIPSIPVPKEPVQPAVQLAVPPVPTFNLSIESYPEGALVALNGNRSGTTPLVMTGIEKNTYTLRLTRVGCIPYEEVFTLDKDTTLSIPLTTEMEALFPRAGTATGTNRYGGLYVTSFPENLALAIDGVEVKGGTPFLFYGLPEGYHSVRVTKTDREYGLLTYTRQVWVYHDALVKTYINTEEGRVVKQVSITSSPYSGGEFTVNGRYPPGRIPSTLNIEMPGSFISVRSGESYISSLVPMLNTNTIKVDLKKPGNPHGPLEIYSDPEGAEIFVDGFRTGHKTPYTFKDVSAGLHKVALSIPGYYPDDQIVTVPIQDTNSSVQRVFFRLENFGEGTIIVDSMPQGANIYLNGWATGETTPHTFDHLKIGFYEVMVSQGGKPWINQLELSPKQVRKVVANFNIIY